MVIIWSLKAALSGLLFGFVFATGMFLIAEKLVASMLEDEPNDEFLNSEIALPLFKYGIPVMILFGSIVVVGPVFAVLRESVISKESFFGLQAETAWLVAVFVFAMFLNVLVFVTRTPFPWVKVVANTNVFVSFGLLLHLLSKIGF